MDRREKIKYKWKEIYSYVLPTMIVIVYMIYILLVNKEVVSGKLIQDSKNFDKMLEALITFMSIILSVFGFLIPSFLSGKGEIKAINYFLKYADMKLFAKKLKNIVAIGLVNIFITSVLLLTDIISTSIINLVILIWLWLLFNFMCNSYRFITIMINLLIVQKEDYVQKSANEISNREKEELHSKLRKM